MLLQLLIFNTSGKELRVESRSEVSCEQGKLAEQVFRRLDGFRSPFYEPNSSVSSYLEKHENPSWWWLLLGTPRNLHDTGRKLPQKIGTWLHVFPLHQNHIYCSVCLWNSYLICCLLGCSPHFAPQKPNFQLSCCVFLKSALRTYLFIHSSPNSFLTCLQWDSHDDISRPWNVRGSALNLYSPGAWKHPLWDTRLHPFTAECTRFKYHRQTWSHMLMMEKATKQKVPMSLNHPLNRSKPEDLPDLEGLHCALQRRKDKFLLWWKSSQFILYFL